MVSCISILLPSLFLLRADSTCALRFFYCIKYCLICLLGKTRDPIVISFAMKCSKWSTEMQGRIGPRCPLNKLLHTDMPVSSLAASSRHKGRVRLGCCKGFDQGRPSLCRGSKERTPSRNVSPAVKFLLADLQQPSTLAVEYVTLGKSMALPLPI